MEIRSDRRSIRVITEKEGEEPSVEVESIEEENTYKKEFIDFYEVVNGKENSLGSPAEALEDLRVIEEAIKSSEL
jgi:predicted dehydrogenase